MKLYLGDNLEILKNKINKESIDLCYIDPPFNSNRNYYINNKNKDFAFSDTWKFDSNFNYDLNKIIDNSFKNKKYIVDILLTIKNSDKSKNKSLFTYLYFVFFRVNLIYFLLKDSGTFYFHCDTNIVYYIKIILDLYFGANNFRNEIIWKRTSAHNGPKKLGVIDDRILVYSKNVKKVKFNRVYTKYSKEYLKKMYKYSDRQGVFARDNLGAYYGSFKYRFSDLSSPSRSRYMYEYKGYKPPENGWRCPIETMRKYDDEGLIYYPDDKSKRLRLKRYLDLNKGVLLQTIWTDINPISSWSKEGSGYPTQKPIELLKRIIRCSSNEGDLILDPFCGSGTTLVAAKELNRKYIGIDIQSKAIEIAKKRLESENDLFQ